MGLFLLFVFQMRARASAVPTDQLGAPRTLPALPACALQDDDGSGYLVYASEDNAVLHIARLAEDYESVGPASFRALEGLGREAPAAFKHQARARCMAAPRSAQRCSWHLACWGRNSSRRQESGGATACVGCHLASVPTSRFSR